MIYQLERSLRLQAFSNLQLLLDTTGTRSKRPGVELQRSNEHGLLSPNLQDYGFATIHAQWDKLTVEYVNDQARKKQLHMAYESDISLSTLQVLQSLYRCPFGLIVFATPVRLQPFANDHPATQTNESSVQHSPAAQGRVLWDPIVIPKVDLVQDWDRSKEKQCVVGEIRDLPGKLQKETNERR